MKSVRIRTIHLTTCALFAAMSAAFSQISVLLGSVPINFIHVSIFIAAGLLGKYYGALSQAVFVLLGAVGIPVFSGFKGGLGHVLGPTGGFIIGYILCAFVTGFITEKFGISVISLLCAMYAGWVITYVTGVAWYIIITGTKDFFAVFSVCILPFLPGDVIKTVIAIVAVNRLKPVYNKRFLSVNRSA